jgi:hypothetical protein
MLQCLRVEQERRDVLEDDPRPGKVGDVADVLAKLDDSGSDLAEVADE